MKDIIRILATGFIVYLLTAVALRANVISGNKPAKVLIISGSNNHEWQETTPYLEALYLESGLFLVEITEEPDTLNPTDLSKFDVIVSNWNSWPENKLRWPELLEQSLLQYIRQGGGFVTFHSSTSAFYEWPEFKKISTGAWIIDSTWHGKNSTTHITIENRSHPVTRGMSDFYLFDELWIDTEMNPNFEILGSASNKEIFDKGQANQPAIMVSRYGKGNIFHTVLGHDVKAMRNTGYQVLMLRGTEWAATGNVTQPLPYELQNRAGMAEKEFTWHRTDTSFALYHSENILWQYNFNTKHGRPFFHPVYAGKNNITCVSPDDHPWHLGQWFCWKYINGVNYWEYQNGTFQSEGITKIENIEITTNPDFSAEISLRIVYHPAGGEQILSEHRKIQISPPQNNGNIWMDYDFKFKALADTVLLDRTPIEGEPGGQSWGGYAGLSVRFNQSFMNSRFISSWKDTADINGGTGDWLNMGFTGLDGSEIGSQMMIAPHTKRKEAAWYSVNSSELPFYYFSPAYLYKKSKLLLKDETINLNYRVLHYNGNADYDALNEEFEKYRKELNQ